jgi:hypothetical protein
MGYHSFIGKLEIGKKEIIKKTFLMKNAVKNTLKCLETS